MKHFDKVSKPFILVMSLRVCSPKLKYRKYIATSFMIQVKDYIKKLFWFSRLFWYSIL